MDVANLSQLDYGRVRWISPEIKRLTVLTTRSGDGALEDTTGYMDGPS